MCGVIFFVVSYFDPWCGKKYEGLVWCILLLWGNTEIKTKTTGC
jgi:hypothetical protein